MGGDDDCTYACKLTHACEQLDLIGIFCPTVQPLTVDSYALIEMLRRYRFT
jgi:hypothetical protein